METSDSFLTAAAAVSALLNRSDPLWAAALLLLALGAIVAVRWRRRHVTAHAASGWSAAGVDSGFRLLPYFSAVSLCFVVAATAGLSALYRQSAISAFIDAGESGNLQYTRFFANLAWPQFRPHIGSLSTLAPATLQADPNIVRLHQSVRAMMHDSPIVKLTIYALDGRTVYSSEMRQLGADASANPRFQAARAGTVMSELVQPDHLSAFETGLRDSTLLSSTLPLRPAATAPVEAVIEVYRDVTPYFATLQRRQAVVTVAVAALLLLLYGMLFLAVRRAGRIIGAQSSAQTAAAAALRASEAQSWLLAETVQQSRDAIWTHRLDGVVTSWNDAAAALFGFTEAQAIGVSVRQLHMAGMSEAEWQEMRARFTDRVPRRYEARRHTQSGSLIDVEVSTAPMFDASGQHIARIVFMCDVSARKQIECELATHREQLEQQIAVQAATVQQLRLSEARNRLLAKVVKQSGEANYTRDLDGVVTSWNDAAARLFGISEAAAVGTQVRQLHLADVSEAEYAAVRNRFHEKIPQTHEAQRRGDDGLLVDLRISTAPLFGDDGGHIGSIVVLANITSRKRVERELAQYRDGLERQVAERTHELSLARDAAQAASRTKSDFMATMSHEIRTPMNGVLGMTELLLGTALAPKQRRLAETVQRSGIALLSVINDILEFSRIEAGRLELESGPFHLRDLVEDVVDTLADSAHRKSLNLACALPVELPLLLMGDSGRLRQILLNLAGNAIKFSARGDVLVRVAALADADRASGTVLLRFEVSDAGIGLAADQCERIFNAFTQAAGQSSRQYGGTGLGLSICKQLVEKMGGTIGVESTVGRGSTFWFTLRLAQQPVSAALTATAKMRLDTVGCKALIVVDNGVNQETLGHQLAAAGIRHETAGGGAQSIERLRAAAAAGAPYDLALIDDQLSGMDGVELARAIRAQLPLAGLPLIMLSARGDTEGAARAAGISAYLLRPVRQSDLYDCIVSVLGGKLTAAALVPVPGAVKRNLDAQVLLVEDHPVNQELALAVLESLGCRTRLAQHGREALDLLAHTAFDLVLMDCQMPVMDGFEAVAEIRCREAAAGGAPRIPVIALTAGAIQGDREKCLAAGMDDYLTKPFSTEQLGVVLTRWLPAARRAASGPACATGPGAGAAPALASVPSAAPSASATQIDRRILERMQALQGGAAGAAFVRRIIGIYLGDASVRMGSLREAVARNDPAALARCAHALRSASATVGASALADLCRQMESLGQAALRDAAAGAGVPVTEGRADDWADGVAAGAAGAAGAASAAALLRAIDTSFALAAAELTTI